MFEADRVQELNLIWPEVDLYVRFSLSAFFKSDSAIR